LFVSSSSTSIVVEVIKYDPPTTIGYFTDPWGVQLGGPRGLPLFKPPYKRVTAIDLNTGDHAWQQPHGDGPRFDPALADLDLPPLGGGGGLSSGPLVTPTLLIMNHGGRDYEDIAAGTRTISAYDKDTGDYIGSVDLPAVPGGNPISYMHEGKQHLVLAVGSASGEGNNPELIALRLP
jgi:quinoprotein glucose dehydrogenase